MVAEPNQKGNDMSDRATQLHATASGQITELLALISTLNTETLVLPCRGREKLGDGTIAASLGHTADNYQRIAAFVQTSDRMPNKHAVAGAGAHRVPRFVRALGHGTSDPPITPQTAERTRINAAPARSILAALPSSSQPHAPRSARSPS